MKSLIFVSILALMLGSISALQLELSNKILSSILDYDSAYLHSLIDGGDTKLDFT